MLRAKLGAGQRDFPNRGHGRWDGRGSAPSRPIRTCPSPRPGAARSCFDAAARVRGAAFSPRVMNGEFLALLFPLEVDTMMLDGVRAARAAGSIGVA